MTNSSESLFKYDDGLGHADFINKTFVPKFLDQADPEVVANATTFCKNNTQCIFDLVFTDNRELAAETTATEDQAAENEASAGNDGFKVFQIRPNILHRQFIPPLTLVNFKCLIN